MNPASAVLERFAGTTALVVGDLMVDAYLWGRVDRISPEAPVPVVQVQRRSSRLGGAANVALNMHALGARPIVVGAAGHDAAGDDMHRLLEAKGLATAGLLRVDGRPTTVKTRVISGHQHIVRVDEETDEDLAPVQAEALIALVQRLIAGERPQVVVLEDYNKGVLTEAVITGIIRSAQEAGIPVAVDPKLRNFFAYRGVDLFKPNLKELREGLKTDLQPGDIAGVERAVEELERRLGNRATLVTLSEHGAYAHGHGEAHHVAAHPRSIADVSGAGDTVIAVAALAMAQGMPLRTMAALANLAGGLVCEHVGVVPVDAARFEAECERTGILS